MPFSTQFVILAGGKGTRLGAAAVATPKPLMAISEGRVFLDYLIASARRQGFSDILLLAGHLGDQIADRYAGDADIRVLIEPEPLGTGGAFRFALPYLADSFIATNGDTLFDTNFRALDHGLLRSPHLMANIAVRDVPDAARFGSVDLKDGHITAFREKDLDGAQAGLINGGVYALRREAIGRLPDGASSIEHDLFPQLASRGQLGGRISDGYFIDIGLPDTLDQARREIPARRRPALFLDRDGVINEDINYLYRIEDLVWIDGVRDLITRANDKGMAVVVVTNQAGVAHGYYTEADIKVLHDHIQRELNAAGAFIDAFYYCPYHPQARITAYLHPDHADRKPNCGMITRAAANLGLDLPRSLLIGDRETDIEAATRAGVRSLLFTGGNLVKCVDAQGGL